VREHQYCKERLLTQPVCTGQSPFVLIIHSLKDDHSRQWSDDQDRLNDSSAVREDLASEDAEPDGEHLKSGTG